MVSPDQARRLARIRVGRSRSGLRVHTRNGYDFTDEFALPVKRLAARGTAMVLDGEIAVPNQAGLTHLDWLHDARTRHRPDRLAFFAFDLLYFDGFDLCDCPLEERIAILNQLISEAGCPRVLSVGHLVGGGAEFFAKARNAGAEGIVSKRLGKQYIAGESPYWLKTKVHETRRFVVTGYETEKGKLHAVHVAEERDGELIPQGRVKKGLSGLLPRLEAIRYPGFRDRDGVVPVKPQLYVDVKFFGRIARDGKIPGGSIRDGVVVWFETGESPARKEQRPRLTVFSPKWWSCDTPAVIAAMSAEPQQPEPTAPRRFDVRGTASIENNIVVNPEAAPTVPPESIQRALDDAVVPNRDQLIAHWKAISDLALEYLARRPLTLVRHVGGLTFFHEGALPSLATGVHQMTYKKRRDGSTGYRVWIEDLAGLVGLVDMGAVELHPWGATIDDIEHPDTLVLDLDPDPNIEWGFVVETALKLREIFDEEGLSTWPKLTGGKGVHVVVPVEPTLTWEQGRAYIRSIAERLATTAPSRYTLSSSLAVRPGRIYLDYARNGLGSTAIGCYPPRARPGFPIAIPVSWEDLESGIRSNSFTLAQPGAQQKRPHRRSIGSIPGDDDRRGITLAGASG